jgi:hypothetical protein
VPRYPGFMNSGTSQHRSDYGKRNPALSTGAQTGHQL